MQWSCLLKTKLSTFLKTNNEAAYRKYPMHDPRDHATHRQFLIFSLAVNCQTEAKEDAYMKRKLGSRESAWSTNMNFVSLLNGSNATTITWCESFSQAVFPPFFFFFSFFFLLELHKSWIGITTLHHLNSFLAEHSYLKTIEQLQPASRAITEGMYATDYTEVYN